MKLWLVLLAVSFQLAAISQPALPPDFKPVLQSPRAASVQGDARMATVALPTVPNGIFSIVVTPLPVRGQQVECFISTNRPARWRIERSFDLVNWSPLSNWATPSNQPTHLIPKMRDNAKLVDWFLFDQTVPKMFFRIQILP